MSFLLDTNVVSEIRRGRDRHVRAWVADVADVDLHFSVLALGEVRRGIDLLRGRDPAQAMVSDSWFRELHTRFVDRTLSIDARVAEEWVGPTRSRPAAPSSA